MTSSDLKPGRTGKRQALIDSIRRLFGLAATSSPKPSPDIGALSFDLTDCSAKEDSPLRKSWLSANRVAHLLRFESNPVSWTFDLTSPDAATAFYRQQCEDNKGAMLSMEVSTQNGVEILRGLFKYRSPYPDHPGMQYVGIIWIPFDDCNFQLNIEALEDGLPGERETAVMLLAGDSWTANDAPPIKVASAAELFDKMNSAPVLKLPSDDEGYDSRFPMHPFSRVRARMNQVTATLRIDPPLKPFRFAGCTALPEVR